jgi:uncharacterized protein YydD (DUF2326 family)
VDKYNAEIERLHLELASFNKRIEELEQFQSQSSTVEALKSSALMLSRQIDDLRSSIATEQLTGLLAKELRGQSACPAFDRDQDRELPARN